MFLISLKEKTFLGTRPTLDNKEVSKLKFQFVISNGSVVPPERVLKEGSSIYLACSVKTSNGRQLIMFSDVYTVSENYVEFDYTTNTAEFSSYVKQYNTIARLEIGYTDDEEEKIILRDTCIVNPRIYCKGTPQPLPIQEYFTKNETIAFVSVNYVSNDEISNYYTKQQTDNAIEAAISGLTPVPQEETDPIFSSMSGIFAQKTDLNAYQPLSQAQYSYNYKIKYISPYSSEIETTPSVWWDRVDNTPMFNDDKKIYLLGTVDNSEWNTLYFQNPARYASYEYSNNIKTIEVWIQVGKLNRNINTIEIPNSFTVMDEENFPTELYGDQTSDKDYTYHVFVVRLMDLDFVDGEDHVVISYNGFFNSNADLESKFQED